MVQGLGKSFIRYRDDMSGQQVFRMFLLKTIYDVPEPNKRLQIQMLLEAASKGYTPAQAITQRVLESYEELTEELSPRIRMSWLYNAASTGSLSGRSDLALSHPGLAQNADEKFRNDTGHNQFYSPIPNTSSMWTNKVVSLAQIEETKADGWRDTDGNSNIHYFAAHGNGKALELLLTQPNHVPIDHRNTRGETALYKACLSGRHETVLGLCRYRADASLRGFPNGATCLHWLFNFPASQIDEVTTALVHCGADPNALLSSSVPVLNYHWPFTWPAGSPLHWAIAASNVEAIKALLRVGSNPCCLRSTHDPYITDQNVRQFRQHGNHEEGSFSETPKHCQGFSVLDLAAARHDWKVLECIRLHYKDFHIFSCDEEGYTPFHRLEQQRVGRTGRGTRFWQSAFTGNPSTREDDAFRTCQTLQAMGGDINQLTGSPRKPDLQGVAGLTPLMIAVTKSDTETVAALLRCGANPNAVNRSGRTALTLLPEDAAGLSPPGSIYAIIQQLLKYNADADYLGPDEMTPLLSAVHSGDVGAILALVEAGVDLTRTYKGLNIIALLLLTSRYRYSLGHPTMIISGIRTYEEIFASIIRLSIIPQNQSLNFIVDRDNGTFLHYAAQAGWVTCISALLEAGADINAVRSPDPFMPKAPSYSHEARRVPRGTPLDIVEMELRQIPHRHSNSLKQEREASSLLCTSLGD